MNNIIAQTLLDWTLNSNTTFLEAADKELITAAEKFGLVLPSPDLAIFKTIYAEIDVPNRNKMIVKKEPVEKGLKTLLGKQINWNHDGAGHICGYILDAKIENNFITIIGVLFKSQFRDEFKKVEELFADKKLFVSFEIWAVDPTTGKDVTYTNNTGILEINPIIFSGCGLLLKDKPACPKARVFKLLAKENIIKQAEKIVAPVFKRNPNLVYAELAIPQKCENCGKCTCDIKEVDKVEKVEEQKVETPVAEIQGDKVVQATEAPATETKTVETAAQAPVEPVAETKVEEAAPSEPKTEVVEQKVEATEKKEEVKAEEVVEPVEPPKMVKRVREEICRTEYVPTENGEQSSRKGKNRITTYFSDGKEAVEETEFEVVDKFAMAEVEVKIAEATKEIQSKLEAKEVEVTELKTKLTAQEQELTTLKASKEEKKPEIVEASIGSAPVVSDDDDSWKKIQEEVDRKAFARKK